MSCSRKVFSESQTHKLPLVSSVEEVAVGGSDMILRGDARSATEDDLVCHKFAVIFANCSGGRLKSGIRLIGTLSPFPDIAK